jgi:transposase-like protein
VRCVYCGSLETKRKGRTSTAPTALSGRLPRLQRFVCRSCGRSFTSARKCAATRAKFADDVVLEAVRLYIQGLCSYRTVAALLERRLGKAISRATLNGWITRAADRSKTPLQVSAELHPAWGGFLGVDGKAVRIAAEKWFVLVAVDIATRDVVHAVVLPWETREGFIRLITETITAASYPLRGIVADLRRGFDTAYREHFARVPYQACRIHFDRRLDWDVPFARGTAREPLAEELKDRLRGVLYAPSMEEAAELLRALTAERDRFRGLGRIDVLHSLERYFGLYMTHHRVPGLPPDNNVTENVIKQLGKKPRLMEGFSTVDSAERYLRLVIGCYRVKRFTDSRASHRNGKAPLELAGVEMADRDWPTLLLDGESGRGAHRRTH